jgi:hypothetical protein
MNAGVGSFVTILLGPDSRQASRDRIASVRYSFAEMRARKARRRKLGGRFYSPQTII